MLSDGKGNYIWAHQALSAPSHRIVEELFAPVAQDLKAVSGDSEYISFDALNCKHGESA